jgi:UDP-glucose 4-epimerase
VRPHNVIGIYQNIWDRYRNVIGIWIRKVLAGEPLTIYGDGTQVRAFSDISFYMEPFEKLMFNHDGEIFNIGADKEYSINQVADILIKVSKEFGYNPEKIYLEKRDEVHIAYSDHTKAKNLLNFKDNTDLEKTVREMFTWASKIPPKNVKYANYEIEKNLYSYWKK